MRQLRTLIADHDRFTAQLAETILHRQLGPELILQCAHERGEVEAGLKSREYDLILLDVDDSPLEGLKLLQLARAIDPWTRIVAMTANGSSSALFRAFELGAATHFLKPINPAGLVDLVEFFISQRQRWQHAVDESAYSVV